MVIYQEWSNLLWLISVPISTLMVAVTLITQYKGMYILLILEFHALIIVIALMDNVKITRGASVILVILAMDVPMK